MRYTRGLVTATRPMKLILNIALLPALLAGAVHASGADYDSAVVFSLNEVVRGDHETALNRTKTLLEAHPESRLGQLLLADLYAARAGLGVGIEVARENQAAIRDLRDEMQLRWSHFVRPAPSAIGLLPASLINTAERDKQVLFADLNRGRLYLYDTGESTPKVVKSYYITIGLNGTGKTLEGDKKTPVGVYRITGYIPGAQLPPRYGPGALPINYPNEWDVALNRTGYGIWFHGTEPGWVTRGPRASDGCITLSDSDFLDLRHRLAQREGTPVVIDANPSWVEWSATANNRKALLQVINRWRTTLEAGNWLKLSRYYDLDDTKTLSDTRPSDIGAGFAYRVALKKNPPFGPGDVSIFRYPGDRELYVVEYPDPERAPRLHAPVLRQYWHDTGGDWRIISETYAPQKVRIAPRRAL